MALEFKYELERHQEAMLAGRCKDCGAKKGKPCVYLAPKPQKYSRESSVYRLRLALAGKPTRRVHNSRLNMLYVRKAVRNKQERMKRLMERQKPRHDIVAAMRQFDLDEWNKMKKFLKADGLILIDIPGVKDDTV